VVAHSIAAIADEPPEAADSRPSGTLRRRTAGVLSKFELFFDGFLTFGVAPRYARASLWRYLTRFSAFLLRAMDLKENTTIQIGDFLMDRRAQRLWHEGRAIDLVPQVWALLSLLVDRTGQLVTKDEILESAWRGIAVSDAALSQAVRRLRAAFGDDARQPRYIATVHRRGFRLIAATRVSDEAGPAVPRTGVDLPPFVGRRAELDRLGELLRSAGDGERQIVFVEGEAGIGKTALLAYFRAENCGARVQIAAAHCVQQHGSTEPYLPVLEALDRLAKSSPPTLEVLRRHAPTWLVQMPWLLGPEEVQGLESAISDATRTRMLREMARAVDEVAADRPLILLLEDLHWADEATLDLLASVARRPDPARLMVLATYRPAEAIAFNHPVISLCRALWTSGSCSRISLQALSRDETAKYLAQRFAERPFEANVGDRIHARSEGNPLFLGAMVDHLIARGCATAGGGNDQPPLSIGEEDLREIPGNVREMIELQLASLDAEEQNLLSAASVAAVEFRSASVAAALGLEDSEGLEEVENACARLIERRRLLRAVDEEVWPDGTRTATFAFHHQLYRQVLYERLQASRRRRLHQRIGERLERGFAAAPRRVAAEIANHFAYSGDDGKAIVYFVLAARQAHRRFADREAASLLECALHHLASSPAGRERDQYELQVRLGIIMAHWLAELDRPEDEKHLERIQQLGATLGSEEIPFQLCHRLWTVYTYRSLPRLADPLAERLLKIATDPGQQLEARLSRAITSLTRGKFAQATVALEEALVIYGEGDPPACAGFPGYEAGWESTGARMHGFLGAAFISCGALDRASAHLASAIKLCQQRVHPKYTAAAHLAVAGFHCVLGQIDIAQALSDRGQRLAEENGFANLIVAAAPQRTWLKIRSGRGENVRNEIATAIQQFHRNRSFNPAPVSPMLLADACRMTGLVDEGLALVETVWRDTRAPGVHWYDADLRRLEGELLLVGGGRGAAERAEVCFRDAIAIADRQGAPFYGLRAATSLARLYQRGRKRQESRDELGRICATFTEGFDAEDVLAARALLERC